MGDINISFNATDPDFRYEISEPTIESMALDTPLDARVVTATVAAHQWAAGRRPEIYGLSGCTDAPNFACPSVICGPGSLARAHTVDEYVEIEELSLATRIYLHAALGLLATTTSSP